MIGSKNNQGGLSVSGEHRLEAGLFTTHGGHRGPEPRDPERTRRCILKAATYEFAEKGFSGARIDAIAKRAQANKRLIYHHFGNKEDLFLTVLENTYANIRRAELDLALTGDHPAEAIRKLAVFTWQYYLDHPEFVRLVSSENLEKGVHLSQSRNMQDLNYPVLNLLEDILGRGKKMGVFREDVDPVQLYMTIAGISYFYVSHHFTASLVFQTDLMTPEALAERRAHIIDVIDAYMKRPDSA